MLKESVTKTIAIISFPWENEDKTAEKVFQIYIDDLIGAVRCASHNPVMLEDIRKALICVLHEVEELLARAQMPNTMRDPVQ